MWPEFEYHWIGSEFTIFPLWYPPIWTHHSWKPKSELCDAFRQKPTSSGLKVKKGYSRHLKEMWKSPGFFSLLSFASTPVTRQLCVRSHQQLPEPTRAKRTHRTKEVPLLSVTLSCSSKSTSKASPNGSGSRSCSLYVISAWIRKQNRLDHRSEW